MIGDKKEDRIVIWRIYNRDIKPRYKKHCEIFLDKQIKEFSYTFEQEKKTLSKILSVYEMLGIEDVREFVHILFLK